MTGGDIREITINHPTVGSGRLFGVAGADSTTVLGGYTHNDDAQGTDSGGRVISQMVLERWSFETTVSCDMNDSRELQLLQKLRNSPVPAEFTISYANGSVYTGTGFPVGDLALNSKESTIALKLSGGGQLKEI